MKLSELINEEFLNINTIMTEEFSIEIHPELYGKTADGEEGTNFAEGYSIIRNDSDEKLTELTREQLEELAEGLGNVMSLLNKEVK